MEKEFEQYLGGAPQAAVKEFEKPKDMMQPDQLSEEELMGVVSGINYGTAYEFQKDRNDLFSEQVLERESEFASMFKELEQNEQESIQIKK